jgi:hypothetical protein
MTTQETAAETILAPAAPQVPSQVVETALAPEDELSDVCLAYASGGIIVVCRHVG